MEVKLLVLEGKQKGRAIPLPETIFLIGRDAQCHLRPHCEKVSKLHCAIAGWAGQVRVRDLKSLNGTFLNGQPIHGEVAVRHGDKLQVGELVFAFHITNEEEGARIAPIRDEHGLEWLLNPADSAVLSAAPRTREIPARDTESKQEAAEPTRGSKAVSGGEHLRAYFRDRKRRPRSEQLDDTP